MNETVLIGYTLCGTSLIQSSFSTACNVF